MIALALQTCAGPQWGSVVIRIGLFALLMFLTFCLFGGLGVIERIFTKRRGDGD